MAIFTRGDERVYILAIEINAMNKACPSQACLHQPLAHLLGPPDFLPIDVAGCVLGGDYAEIDEDCIDDGRNLTISHTSPHGLPRHRRQRGTIGLI